MTGHLTVIGAGLAGLGAARTARRDGHAVTIVDSRASWGGHTSSDRFAGHWFDEGPHLSFTQDADVRELFRQGADAAGGSHELPARISNWYDGHWVEHPAHAHLHGLPADLVQACLDDKASADERAHDVPGGPAPTYADWLVDIYGRTYAETFPFAYTRKYWTVEPERLGTDWIGSRMHRPSLDQMRRGAAGRIEDDGLHYLQSYRYPLRGGFASFLGALDPGADFLPGRDVVAVDPVLRRLGFADGSALAYDDLVSTMPLDRLVRALTGVTVPAAVRDATHALLCTSVVLVDVCVDRAELFDHEWFYVYDEDISFARAHLPTLLAPWMSPPGESSIQVEIYHSRHRPLPDDPADLPSRVVSELCRMGLLRSTSEVLAARARSLTHANVVFDHDRASAVAVVRTYLAELGIAVAGRYGEWEYHWTDDALRSGQRAAMGLTGTGPSTRPAP